VRCLAICMHSTTIVHYGASVAAAAFALDHSSVTLVPGLLWPSCCKRSQSLITQSGHAMTMHACDVREDKVTLMLLPCKRYTTSSAQAHDYKLVL
jgi:hypothetical protein